MVITFAGQKGGTGKTTLLIAMATCLYYNFDKKVRVIDSDVPQSSLVGLRNFESERIAYAIKELKENNRVLFYLRKCLEFRKQTYKVEESDVMDIKEKLYDTKTSQRSYSEEYVFVDTLGSINSEGYDEVFRFSDYIIVPMNIDMLTLKSNMNYIEKVVMPAKEKGYIKDFFVVLNKAPMRAPKDIEQFYKLMDKQGIRYFNNFLPDGVGYVREPMANPKFYKTGLRSTYLPTSDVYINRMAEEFIDKIV